MIVVKPIKRTAQKKYLLWKEERRRRQWLQNYNRLRKDAFKGLHRESNIDEDIIYAEEAS